MYFYNARWYDPALARFVQADTLVPEPGNPQALNRYAYVTNNPVRYTDPGGHCAQGDVACLEAAQRLYRLYGWHIAGIWSLEEVLLLLDAAGDIERWFDATGGNGQARMRALLGGTSFAHAGWLWRQMGYHHVEGTTVYLIAGQFGKGNVIHEIGHVLDNVMGERRWGAALGGGASDEMISALGGNPCACPLRFYCKEYKPPYPKEMPTTDDYWRRGPSEDFAESVRLAIEESEFSATHRGQWLSNRLSLEVRKEPELAGRPYVDKYVLPVPAPRPRPGGTPTP